MISKERFLAGLNEIIYVEEGFVTMLVNLDKALIDQTEGIEESKKKKITKMLSRLYRDSSSHKKKIDEMIARIGGNSRDEY